MERRTLLISALAASAAPSLSTAVAPAANNLLFLIPGVAADFDARVFLATLQSARLNSVNIFAKRHHGYACYDTRIAAKHPSLKIDLLREVLRVCRQDGICANYYYSLSRVHADPRPEETGNAGLDRLALTIRAAPFRMPARVVAENQRAGDDILKQPPHEVPRVLGHQAIVFE